MKLAVVGKGGVGKTSIAGTLARAFASRGYDVLAVDADPNLNLAVTLGIPHEISEKITPISQELELMESRVKTSFGGILSFTPRVDDVVDRYGIRGPGGVRLLVMGTVRSGDSGCLCPENAFLKALLSHLVLGRKEIVILDMVAGLEHLGRGTARGVDAMLVVVEPSMKSIETASRTLALAKDIGVGRIFGVGNKISSPEEKEFIEKMMERTGIPIIELIPFDRSLVEAEMLGISPMDFGPESLFVEKVKSLASELESSSLGQPSSGR